MLKEGIKLVLHENKHIIIRNYNLLKEINKEQIIIDSYEINGEFLQIKILDEEYIELHGKIKTIKVMDY